MKSYKVSAPMGAAFFALTSTPAVAALDPADITLQRRSQAAFAGFDGNLASNSSPNSGWGPVVVNTEWNDIDLGGDTTAHATFVSERVGDRLKARSHAAAAVESWRTTSVAQAIAESSTRLWFTTTEPMTFEFDVTFIQLLSGAGDVGAGWTLSRGNTIVSSFSLGDDASVSESVALPLDEPGEYLFTIFVDVVAEQTASIEFIPEVAAATAGYDVSFALIPAPGGSAAALFGFTAWSRRRR